MASAYLNGVFGGMLSLRAGVKRVLALTGSLVYIGISYPLPLKCLTADFHLTSFGATRQLKKDNGLKKAEINVFLGMFYLAQQPSHDL